MNDLIQKTYIMRRLFIFALLLSSVGILSAQSPNLIWPPKKYPVNIPFKVLSDIEYWEIKSITCIGYKSDKKAYRFKIKGIGLKSTKELGYGSMMLEIAPEEKNSTKINQSSTGSYMFPSVEAGESFEFEITALFNGYYNKTKFAGFLIFKL